MVIKVELKQEIMCFYKWFKNNSFNFRKYMIYAWKIKCFMK